MSNLSIFGHFFPPNTIRAAGSIPDYSSIRHESQYAADTGTRLRAHEIPKPGSTSTWAISLGACFPPFFSSAAIFTGALAMHDIARATGRAISRRFYRAFIMIPETPPGIAVLNRNPFALVLPRGAEIGAIDRRNDLSARPRMARRIMAMQRVGLARIAG